MATTDAALPHFSLTPGGPLDAIERALRILRGNSRDTLRRVLVMLAITWLPMMLLALMGRLTTGQFPSALSDLALQARFLVAVPLLCVAERSLAMRTERCMDRFAANWSQGVEAEFRRIMRSSARLRDSWLPELILAVAAIAISQAHFWAGTPTTGLVQARPGVVDRSHMVVWFRLVSLPIFQFLVARWVWRWLIWIQLLCRLARLDLHPVAGHPDRRGGFSYLAEPSVGTAWVLAALSSVLAGAWASRVIDTGMSLATVLPELPVAVIILLVVALGPLCVFSPRLWRARFAALRSHGRFVLDYTRRFEDKWMTQRGDGQDPLGSPDIQSMADLAHANAVVREMHIYPFSRRDISILAAAVVVPMLPLALFELPLKAVLGKLGKLAIGTLGV